VLVEPSLQPLIDDISSPFHNDHSYPRSLSRQNRNKVIELTHVEQALSEGIGTADRISQVGELELKSLSGLFG
jgi:hypothetical protein